MAVRIVKVDAVPKRKRKVDVPILSSLDWDHVKTILLADSLGVNEAIIFPITAETLAEFQYPDIRAAARPIKKFVRRVWPGKYLVTCKDTAEGGMVVIRRATVPDVGKATPPK